jgi:hypothetical protein
MATEPSRPQNECQPKQRSDRAISGAYSLILRQALQAAYVGRVHAEHDEIEIPLLD